MGQVLYTTYAVFLSVENETGWIVDSEIIVPKNAQVSGGMVSFYGKAK